MMRKEVADKWTEALRSGKYQQADGQLRKCGANWEVDPSDSAYCCLGVLCDVYAQDHAQQGDAMWGLNGKANTAKWDRGELFMGEEFHLPSAVREWAGMRSENGTLPSCVKVMRDSTGYGQVAWANNLVDLNDNGCSFAEIADVIASHVEVL